MTRSRTAFALLVTAMLIASSFVVAATDRAQADPQQTDADTASAEITNIRLDQAHTMIAAAIAAAKQRDRNVSIAVFDAEHNLKAFARMDGAKLPVSDFAIRKAESAAYFKMPTADIQANVSQDDFDKFASAFREMRTLRTDRQLRNPGGVVTLGGGLPIRDTAGNLIGAIGVSGAPVPVDIEIAQAGIAAIR
ncbi:MAG: heme-binding protein [Planctomycetota bacterium]